jgi:uncharacterized repeat protein (TIGR03803 family)
MAGTVFRMELSGSLTTLHSFTGLDGGIPSDVLAEGSDGRFYGATYAGGLSDYGTLFRVDSSGQFSLLHQFSGAEDGGHPLGGLLAASDGYVYGTTVGVPLDAGTLFRVDVSGGYEVLHEFAPFNPEGHGPVGTLLERSDGNLFGMTRQGGENGRGTVFRLDPQGEVTPFASLDSFDSAPSGGLVEDENGNLYGVQVGDPFTSRGAVFRVDTNGEYKVLHRFNGSDGWSPQARLVRANDGKLYGTAYGGEFAGGVVYRIDPAAIISLDGVAPGSGPAAGGTSVHIFGSAFQAGASVAFGVTPASSVVVVDSSEIVAVAPALFPGAAYDILVANGDFVDATLPAAWVADPLDVPASSLYYDAIVRMLGGLVSAGCGNGNYCPHAPVSRAQLAVLLLKAKLGPLYEPPFASGSVFADVPWDSFAAAWIEDLASRGISAGCGFGKFCPDAPVTRAAMAPLLLKAFLEASYTPPEATGSVFSDVPADSFAAAWTEDLAARGIAAGCSADPALYCPGTATTRGQLAAILVHAFDLQPVVVSGGPVR